MRRLRLDRRQISDLSEVLADCSDVTHLYLQGNSITSSLQVSRLPNLRFLALAHNQLTKLEGLVQLQQLLFLDVSHNLLGAIPTHALPPRLAFLKIQGNPACEQEPNIRLRLAGTRRSLRHIDQDLTAKELQVAYDTYTEELHDDGGAQGLAAQATSLTAPSSAGQPAALGDAAPGVTAGSPTSSASGAMPSTAPLPASPGGPQGNHAPASPQGQRSPATAAAPAPASSQKAIGEVQAGASLAAGRPDSPDALDAGLPGGDLTATRAFPVGTAAGAPSGSGGISGTVLPPVTEAADSGEGGPDGDTNDQLLDPDNSTVADSIAADVTDAADAGPQQLGTDTGLERIVLEHGYVRQVIAVLEELRGDWMEGLRHARDVRASMAARSARSTTADAATASQLLAAAQADDAPPDTDVASRAAVLDGSQHERNTDVSPVRDNNAQPGRLQQSPGKALEGSPAAASPGRPRSTPATAPSDGNPALQQLWPARSLSAVPPAAAGRLSRGSSQRRQGRDQAVAGLASSLSAVESMRASLEALSATPPPRNAIASNTTHSLSRPASSCATPLSGSTAGTPQQAGTEPGPRVRSLAGGAATPQLQAEWSEKRREEQVEADAERLGDALFGMLQSGGGHVPEAAARVRAGCEEGARQAVQALAGEMRRRAQDRMEMQREEEEDVDIYIAALKSRSKLVEQLRASKLLGTGGTLGPRSIE